ncbi:MAG: hypothetical protein LBO67_03630 [Spirochaetaceae bacterium]|jgi:hypothetical protein|nr:hypothetical protein [Spirochaetaceae bacterium]
MVYVWRREGQVYHHAAEIKESAMQAAEQMDGLNGEPEAEVSDEEFESGGCLVRIIDNTLVIGKTEIEKQTEQNAERIRYLKRLLADTDYIAVKIAEGSATTEEYAAQIAQRQAWREEIQQLETIS